jgi:hypothetical protein
MRTLSLQAGAEIVEELSKIGVIRGDMGELPGVFQSSVDVARVAVECDQCHEGVAVVRMPGQIRLQNVQRFVGVARRMQRNGVDIGITGSVRLYFGCRAEFGERVIRPFLADQGEPECVMQAGVLA